MGTIADHPIRSIDYGASAPVVMIRDSLDQEVHATFLQ
eukprot:CAMPEP_0194226442 /NCGR_PEP_ID=MMETSP0156-20130528/41861_1 /TAXON_ID=33649 /ORGANISM="Thalassionema nitzschioides, Strain L26-B" /LENGTH=37 /DNA_ID= /DNA_START= /DNA_END= /DNA_ORIENTATION=